MGGGNYPVTCKRDNYDVNNSLDVYCILGKCVEKPGYQIIEIYIRIILVGTPIVKL